MACSSGLPVAFTWLSAAARELDGGVEGERRELLPLGLLNRLRLPGGELLQVAHELLGVAPERKSESAFHRPPLADPAILTVAACPPLRAGAKPS